MVLKMPCSGPVLIDQRINGRIPQPNPGDFNPNQEENNRLIKFNTSSDIKYSLLTQRDNKTEFLTLEKSMYTQEHSRIKVMQLRCFNRNMGVVYKITENYSFVLYKLIHSKQEVEQSCQSFGAKNKRRFELSKLSEVERAVIKNDKVWDFIFLKPYIVGLIMSGSLIVCNLKRNLSQNCYLKLPISGMFSRRFKFRAFDYDRGTQKLHFWLGNEVGFMIYFRKMKVAGHIDLSALVSKIDNLMEFGESEDFSELNQIELSRENELKSDLITNIIN